MLAIGLSGHVVSGERNASFWLFNHRLWLAAALALLGAGLFGAGLSIILETLNFLFGLGLPSKWHEHIWTVALGFMAPVSWLALAPRNFTEPLGGGGNGVHHPRRRRVSSNSCWCRCSSSTPPYSTPTPSRLGSRPRCPRARSAASIVGYLLAGAATLLLAYPSRDSGRRARAPVLALLGLARADAGVAAVSRGLHAHRGLWPHRAALSDRAHRRLGAHSRRPAHLASARNFDLRLDAGGAGHSSACRVFRALGRHRLLRSQPEG